MKAAGLCIAGGGTGGHVFPALALAGIVRRRWPGVGITFIGAERGLEAKVLPARGEDVLLLPMHGIKGAGRRQRLRVLCWELPRAVRRIVRRWRGSQPRLVIGVGGYASVAGVLAALFRRIPVILYEQNAYPGLVNRRLAPYCRTVLLGFSEAAAHLRPAECVHTGNFVSPEIERVHWRAHTPPRLTVLGGSQGAAFLNEVAPRISAALKRSGHEFVVTHVVGGGRCRVEEIFESYCRIGVEAEILSFCHDMPALYGKTDLLLARSGAMTVSEAAASGVPAVFVPLPGAADAHQWHNAKVMVDRGAALVIDQRRCGTESLASRISDLLFDEGRLRRMSRAARTMHPHDGEERAVRVLSRWLGGDG